jgi:Ca2+-binding RTX toxin-like protein
MIEKTNHYVRALAVLVAAMAAALVMASGTALAVTKTCEPGVACVGTNDPDTLNGTAANDDIFGRGAADTLRGRGATDELFGQGGPDRLFGGPEQDNLLGGPANDALNGGEGIDRYFFGNGWGKDSITEGTPSANTVFFTSPKGSPVPFTEDLTITLVSGEGPEVKNAGATSTINWEGSIIDRVLAGEGDDVITGNAAANEIRGGFGADNISSGAGNDEIHVDDGAGDDVVDCGEQDFLTDIDTVVFDPGDQIASTCEIQNPAT